MDLIIYEENKPLVLDALQNGDFEFIEAASEVFETEFFRFLSAKTIIGQLASTYPTPRRKEEVPIELYIPSVLSMKLHGVHSFNSYPLVVRVGGMLNAFGHEIGRKVHHPDTGDVTLSCRGFNNKNHYDRETPCDKDYLRKLSRDTDPDDLMRWFGGDVVKIFRKHRAFDRDGIFIGDASYLFVPDNPKYEGSVRLLFDEDNHLVDKKAFQKMSDKQKVRCQWRRCYKMVTLLHTNRSTDFFLFVAVEVIPGKQHECPVLYDLVGRFVRTAGKGVMKRLILDRGFVDGAQISKCKKDHGVDVLIPIKRKMDIYNDAAALFRQPDVQWQAYEKPRTEPRELPRPRPEAIEKRERKRQKTLEQNKRDDPPPPPPPEKVVVGTEVAAINGFDSWSSCTVPLSVTAVRRRYADGHEKTFFLMDTKKVVDPQLPPREYDLRSSIEERYRHLKCFSDLCNFTSRALSLVVHQVVFILLSSNLLQYFLYRKYRRDLTKKTQPRIRQQLLPSDTHVIVYWKNYYALFSPLGFAGTLVELNEQARKKIAHKCRQLRRELTEGFTNPRPS